MISDYYKDSLQLKEGARELLEYLKINQVPLCIATATASPLVEVALERLDLIKYFESIHSCVDVGKGKDNPEVFIQAQKSLGTPLKETWVFEDALYAATTAKEAGFTVVGVHDKSAEHHQEELKVLCDYYIESLNQGKDLF
jgi:HAD superfamily hydrolase (TIGR01509 family)